MIILFYHSMAFASGREYRATAYTTVMGSAVQTFVQRTMERKALYSGLWKWINQIIH